MGHTVGDLMVAAVVTADPAETVGEIREKLAQNDIGAVPVVTTAGALVGIVTADDLLPHYEAALPVSRVMSEPAETLPPSTDVRDAARHMRMRRHHHVVVVDQDRVVGILSAFDLLRLLEARE